MTPAHLPAVASSPACGPVPREPQPPPCGPRPGPSARAAASPLPAGQRTGLRGWRCWLAGAIGLLGLAGLARAAILPGELPAQVGRLSALQGDVYGYDRDGADWLGGARQTLRNWPVAAGDRLRTGPDARAELRLGSTTLRLGGKVELALEQLDQHRLVLRLLSGPLALHLTRSQAGDAMAVEVVTPEGRWLPLQPGHYRLERPTEAPSPATQATVWRGELRFEGPDSVLVIPAGRRADLWQDRGQSPTRYAWAPVERDAFADWVARDERGDDAPVTARHVAPGMTGWQDLDRHGDWIASPDHGSVWQPRVVAPGWAPFHDGRWAWLAPWGWTWIDAAPWGFAPFHYGSWLMLGGRWCWSPGPRHLRPRFAPVHSGWVGAPQLSIDIQIGGGHRPPPPRVVIPMAPPPVVVVRPPPAGPGHRPDIDRGRPGWQPGRDQGERRDRPERGNRDERGDRGYRGERGERGDRAERPDRGDHGPAGDRPERPERHHWAERVDRSPVVPMAPAAPAAPVAPVAVIAPVPATLPVKPVPAPVPRAETPRAESPRTEAPRPASPRTDAPRPGPQLPAEGAAKAERPDRPQRAENNDHPERSDGAVRQHRQDAQAWR